MCINVLYVLVPVLVHVLLDGSGHDSAEIDGTVERHATSAPTKQPVPAPRHSTRSSVKTDFHLDLRDTPYSPKHKAEQTKSREDQSPEKSSPKSKIPVKIKKSIENENAALKALSIGSEKEEDKASPLKRKDNRIGEESESAEKEVSELKDNREARTKELIESLRTEVEGPLDSQILDELPVTGSIQRTETVTITDTGDPTRSRTVVQETRVESLPMTETRTTISKTERDVDVSKETIIRTITTVQCVTESNMEQTQILRTISTDLPGMIEQVSAKILKSGTGSETWTQGNLAERFLNEEKADQWESQGHVSQDTSPGSGNGDIYAKNCSSRHELNSDSDSDASPQPRRRSPSKRRTLGSSSGSDVALHEGAELSPLEDDQGTALTANLLSKQCTYFPLNRVLARENRNRTRERVDRVVRERFCLVIRFILHVFTHPLHPCVFRFLVFCLLASVRVRRVLTLLAMLW